MNIIKQINNAVSMREQVMEHVATGENLFNNHYRLQSKSFTDFINEARELYKAGKIEVNKYDQELLESDLGLFAEHEGRMVPLDCPLINDPFEQLEEAKVNGRDVDLNKPMRSSGPKKFKVYVKNPKTGNVKTVHFGAEGGGGNLKVKLADPEARKNFAARHKCETRNDKTTPSYWSCRLPRYAKQLGLSGAGGHWW